jgi:hypothetical protein
MGTTGAKDLLPICVTGAVDLQLRLDRTWLTTPLALRIWQLANVISPNTDPTQPGKDSISWSFCRFCRIGLLRGTVLPYSVYRPRCSYSGQSSYTHNINGVSLSTVLAG